MSKIILGLDARQKAAALRRYVKKHGIARVYIFHPEAFPLEYPGARLVEYKEIIMYRTFYPLLEEIGPSSLLVFNECLRTQNRSELTYNCAHHYCNQTSHKIVFEHFPFIDGPQDFMILLDLLDKGRYKGKSFDWAFLAEQDIAAERHPLTVTALEVAVSAAEASKYLKKKDQLFADLGEGDPDTIPRQLHLVTGGFKKKAVDPGKRYVARNARFNLPNVATYKAVAAGVEYTVIDFPHRRLDFCDFLKITGQASVEFLTTCLGVDDYYLGEAQAWAAELEGFYAKTSLYQ